MSSTIKPLLDDTDDLTISVVTIVKNEAHNIVSFLNSLTDVADELVIADTGSTDDTVDIVRATAKQVSFPVYIDSISIQPFHFGKAKNHVIDKARGSYVFVLDADERLSDTLKQSLRNFLRKEHPTAVSLLRVDELVPHYIDRQIRIFKNGYGMKYGESAHSAVHESLQLEKYPITYWDNYILHEQGPNHWLRKPWRIKQQLLLEISRTSSASGRMREVLRAPLGFFYKFRSVYFRKHAYQDGWNGFMFAFLKGMYAFAYHVGIAFKSEK